MIPAVIDRWFPRGGGSFRGGFGPIGLDFAREQLCLMQMAVGEGGVGIHAAAAVAYPTTREELLGEPGKALAFLRRALKSAPFRGRRVVSTLPFHGTRILNISYRVTSGQDEAEAVLQEIGDYVGGAPADFVIDYLPIRGREKESRERTALVALAPRGKVLDYLDLLLRAGIDVEALDIGPAALSRLMAGVPGESNFPAMLLLNFGRVRSYLTAIAGRRLLMDREVPFGEEVLVARLVSALKMGESEALRLLYDYGLAPATGGEGGKDDAIVSSIGEILKPVFLRLLEEVNKSLIYTASETHGQPVEQVFLLGSVARYPNIVPFMAKMLSIPVAVFDPLVCYGAKGASLDMPTPSAFALATGLALRGVVPHG